MARLEHKDADKKHDDALADEARQHLAGAPALQLVAELVTRLRAMALPWWSAEALRARFGAAERMGWIASRPDLRQRITSKLSGLAPKAARKKPPEFQASLVDAVLDEGDITARDFEEAFNPIDLVTYGPAEAFWRAFLELLPWESSTREHQELAAWVVEALLASSSSISDFKRKPILTPLDVRSAIDGAAWHTRIPLDVRVAIDRARLAAERVPGAPFSAADELAIATPLVMASSLTLRDLAPVFAAAEAAMGFSASARPAPTSHAVPTQRTSVPAPAPVAPPPLPPPPSAAPATRPTAHSSPPIPHSAALPPSVPPPGAVASPRTVPPLSLGSVALPQTPLPTVPSLPVPARGPVSPSAPPSSARASTPPPFPAPPLGHPPAPVGHTPAPTSSPHSQKRPTNTPEPNLEDSYADVPPGDFDVESTNPWDTLPGPDDEQPTGPGNKPVPPPKQPKRR